MTIKYSTAEKKFGIITIFKKENIFERSFFPSKDRFIYKRKTVSQVFYFIYLKNIFINVLIKLNFHIILQKLIKYAALMLNEHLL